MELIVLGFGVFHGILALLGLTLYSFQSKLIFKGSQKGQSVEDMAIDGLKEITFKADDGVDIVAWHIKPKKNMPTLLYYHGNFCNLSNRKDRIKRISKDGYGLFMMSFRGYGRTIGSPSEVRNVADAKTAYDYLVKQGVATKDIIIYGESMGAAVGTQVAAKKKVAALLLESPFTSMIDMAKRMYPFFPIGDYMRDRFETIKHIRKVKAPVMIIHSVHDELVPFEFGETLFKVAGKPKALHLLDKVGHYGYFRAGAWKYIREFIEELVLEQKNENIVKTNESEINGVAINGIKSTVDLDPHVYEVISSKLPLHPEVGIGYYKIHVITHPPQI